MQAPEMVKKLERGPLGFVTIMQTGVPKMAAQLIQWCIYCAVIGILAAYVTGRTLGPGTDYLAVFRVAGTVAFIAYAGAHPAASIWYKRSWATTARFVVDAFVYGLLTAGAFGWLLAPVGRRPGRSSALVDRPARLWSRSSDRAARQTHGGLVFV